MVKEKDWKAYHPLKYEKNDRLRFVINSSSQRICSFCGRDIKTGEPLFTINYSCWLHLNCIDECIKSIQEFKKGKTKELILKMLK